MGPDLLGLSGLAGEEQQEGGKKEGGKEGQKGGRKEEKANKNEKGTKDIFIIIFIMYVSHHTVHH